MKIDRGKEMIVLLEKTLPTPPRVYRKYTKQDTPCNSSTKSVTSSRQTWKATLWFIGFNQHSASETLVRSHRSPQGDVDFRRPLKN